MIRHTNSRSYTAYGALCGVLSGSRLAFCGEYRDRLTGNYLLGNGRRAYNPVLMRFNSPDKLSPFGRGGLNTYAYCSNDPSNRVDRNGAFSIPSLVYGAGALEGALNVIDGVSGALKIVVDSRQNNVRPLAASQAKGFFKFWKGILKLSAAGLGWSEQGGPVVSTVATSTAVDAVAKQFSVKERLLGIYLDQSVVVPYLLERPGQIGGVIAEVAGILSGVSPVKTAVTRTGGAIREER